MRAAIYLRQSQDRDGNHLAVDRQREDCERLCTARGWTGWVEYLDNDRSASSGKRRPDYERLLSDIRAGRVDAVVAWDADRLHRQPRELEDFIDLADAKRLELATVGGDFDLSTPTGRGNARMKGVFSRMEMEQKAARQKRAAVQRAEAGGRNWNVVPFGYRADEDGSVIADPVEAAMVRDAYTSILSGGSLHAIAKKWNADGFTSRRGNPWSGATVRQLLMAWRNAGLASYRGEPTGEGDWPALVDRDILDGVRAVLTRDGRRIGGTSSGRKHLLSGIALCGSCGKTMGSGKSIDGRGVYVCKHCHHVTRDMAGVDRLVVGMVVGRLAQPDAVELLIDTERADIADLRDRAAALRARQAEAAQAFAEDQFTMAEWKAARDTLAARLEEVESKMLSANRAHVFDGVVGVDDVESAFDGLHLDRKRAVIDSLVEVTILAAGRHGRGFNPDSVDIAWK